MGLIRYLLDTDFCVHAIRKRTPAVTKFLSELSNEMALTEVTLYELYYGAERYDIPQTRFAVIEDFRKRFPILPFDIEAARHAANIRATLERQGKSIGNLDTLIAAIARSQNLTLISGNIREFSRVKSLKLKSWR